MERGVFRFKQFSCQHYGSSMRIGVDAVLLGAWATVEGARILDVGTGCGVIALMCAQRNPNAIVDAIDTDIPSIAEAGTNFNTSPWPDRLNAINVNYLDCHPEYRYDRIVSNPPYFSSGVNPETSVRMHARHEGDLSPRTLLEHGRELLNPDGTVSMVAPCIRAEEIIADARAAGFKLTRRVDVRGNANAPLKRSLLEFSLNQDVPTPIREVLTLEVMHNVPTEQYRKLCGDFYLYF